MKPIVRYLFILLCLTVLLGAVSVSAIWETDRDFMLAEAILESYETGNTVDLQAYNVTVDELRELYQDLDGYGFLPWNAVSFRYDYMRETGYVYSFSPVYRDETQYVPALYEQKVAEIIHDTIDPNMSDWQKALAIHDYLAANYAYDETYTYYRGYDLLIRGTAVCNGYAEAYEDIMNRLGIYCITIISEDMDHGWNLVQIDGNWYHVDVTWDDPVSDVPGRVMHDYFLVTDQEMNQDHQDRLKDGRTGHYNWETDILCTDTSFTDAFWKDVDSPICYPEFAVSYLRRWNNRNSYLYCRNEMTGKETAVFKDAEEFISLDGKKKFSYYHIGLSLWQDRLYFSSSDTVYSMELDGSDVQKVYTHKPKKTGTYIYSSYVSNDTLYLTLSDHNFNLSSQQISLPSTGYHVHNYTTYIQPATCTERGREFYTCDCGIWAEALGGIATGHSYTPATCTDPKTCTACGITEGDVLHHSYTYQVVLEPTLREEGLQKKTCIHCGAFDYIDLPRLTFGEWMGNLFS